MNQAIVTSFHRAGQDQYGNNFLKTLTDNLNGELFLFLGIENGVDLTRVEEILQNQKWLEWNYIDLEQLPDLVNFKARYGNSPKHRGVGPNGGYAIKHDVVKFSHKAFTILEAILKAQEGGFDVLWWCDADCHVHSRLPADFLASMVRGNVAINYLGREHLVNPMYAETGIVAFNLNHPDIQKFSKEFRRVYVSGEFEKHSEWHDAFLFSDVIKDHDISRYSWTGNLQTTHPAIAKFGAYLDHRKGARKESRSEKHELVGSIDNPYWN